MLVVTWSFSAELLEADRLASVDLKPGCDGLHSYPRGIHARLLPHGPMPSIERTDPMNRLSPRRAVSLLVSLAIVAIPIIVAALTAAPGCPSCGFQ